MEIKKCPFCGGEADFYPSLKIQCSSCGFFLEEEFDSSHIDSLGETSIVGTLVKRWNRRSLSVDEVLKPCPFCGGAATVVVEDGVKVVCKECGSSTKGCLDKKPVKNKYKGEAITKAINLWNQRT